MSVDTVVRDAELAFQVEANRLQQRIDLVEDTLSALRRRYPVGQVFAIREPESADHGR